jgi:SAM-dependent methyltransferase
LEILFGPAASGEWRKCVVTPGRQRTPGAWQKLTASPVRLSGGQAVKLVMRAGSGERTLTVPPDEWPARLLDAIEAGPCHMDVLTPNHDWHARRTRDGRWLVTRSKPSLAGGTSPAQTTHDRPRTHALPAGDERVRRLFIETGLFGKNGQLLGEAAAKHRQVQHYVELLRHLPVWRQGETVRVVDAGCGKAYLSLALCLWAELNGSSVQLEAVDASPEVIETVRGIANRAGIDGVTAHASSIHDFAGAFTEPVDVLLSLHACDTATDEALAAGVRLGARAIVLVPCCHHELVAQIEARTRSGIPASERWGGALGSGLLRHRLADLVTDSLRSAALDALGYHVDVLEFVSPEATARNLMIRAAKRIRPDARAESRALAGYRALASEWDVQPALEGLLGPLWPPAP